MNVAYHLTKLGKNPALISRIGNDMLGREILEVWQAQQVSTTYIQVDETRDSGKVYAHHGENNEMHYDIVNPSAWDYIQWDDALGPLVQNADYFVFGSLASRNLISAGTLLKCLELAQKKVFDINLRAPYITRENIEILLGKADILKLNQAELHLITGWAGNFKGDEERIQYLQENYKTETIIVTKGGDGAMAYVDNQFFCHAGHKVQVADTVGSGDAFLAGYLGGLLDKSPTDKILADASALGAFVATQTGGCPPYSIADLAGFLG